jgi:hypothetical protein
MTWIVMAKRVRAALLTKLVRAMCRHSAEPVAEWEEGVRYLARIVRCEKCGKWLDVQYHARGSEWIE